MIFNFCITNDNGSSDFGICTASDPEVAMEFICAFACVKPEDVTVEPGAEDLLDQQYGGLAFLTTERG